MTVLVGLLLTAGCASSGAGDVPVGAGRDRTTTVISGRNYSRSTRAISEDQSVEGLMLATRDYGWSRLPAIFEELGIEVTYSNPAAYTMGNQGTRVRRIGGERPSRYLDCGYGSTAQPYADDYEVTMALMVNLVAAEDGTLVTVRVEGSAKPRTVSGHAVNCSSKGTLERRILSLISPS